MNNGKTRASLLGVAALYLLYICYELYQSRDDPNTTMTPAVRIIFIALFVIAGIGLLIYAVREWRRSRTDDDQPAARDDKNSLK